MAVPVKRYDVMLATLEHEEFSAPGWIFERKLDGERCLAVKLGSDVALYSRNGKLLNATYPELVDAFTEQKTESFVADGEIVAFKGSVTSFSRLQGRMQINDPEAARESGIAVKFYVFDILEHEGKDITSLPLEKRKARLRKSLHFTDPIRYTQHRNEDGGVFYQEACRKGWEGVIAKDRKAAYASSRSRSWLKLKCSARQELVIGGFTEPHGKRDGFGALLVGYYEHPGGDTLRYAGRVGTGFDEATLSSLHEKMRGMIQDAPPFVWQEDEAVSEKEVTWIAPEMVCEVAFTEWTAPKGQAAKLRHPRYLGLRRDKNPEDVVREG